MKQTTAALLGFLAAPILPAIYLAIVYPLSGNRDVISISGSFLLFYNFSAVATAIFGVPSYFALKRYSLVAWWSAAACGGLAGALSIAFWTSGFEASIQLRFTLLGAASGLLFWSIWRASRR
jgi:hypothetical protein